MMPRTIMVFVNDEDGLTDDELSAAAKKKLELP